MKETFVSGSLKIKIETDGVTPDMRQRVKGAIILSDGRRWEFTDLASGVGGDGSFESLMGLAESALSFGSYYSTGNRGDDVPEWAPPTEIADAIGSEAFYTPERIGFVHNVLPRNGHSDEMDTVYVGDLFCVFASAKDQDIWTHRIDGDNE